MAEGAAKPKAAASSKLQQMGFMKRAAARRKQAEDAKHEPAELKQDNSEEWSVNIPETTGCVIIVENDPEPGAKSGRFSFGGLDKKVESKDAFVSPSAKRKTDQKKQDKLMHTSKRSKIESLQERKSSGKKTRYFEE